MASVKEVKNDASPIEVNTLSLKNSCKAGDAVYVKVMICKATMRTQQRDGRKYFKIIAQDSKGQVECNIWGDELRKVPAEFIERLESSNSEKPVLAVIGGYVDEYRGSNYITVKGIKPLEGDYKKYIPGIEMDDDKIFDIILNIVDEIREPFRTILLNNLKRDEELFKSAPAAQIHHDNFRGGMLEHTYKMLMAYVPVADLYPKVDKDIMIFIIICHDYEKINGYRLLPSIEKTYQEELVGHQVMGAIAVYNDLKSHNVPDMTVMAILNALLSHHGKAEWGAVKPAMTMEARLLQHMDYMVSDIARTYQTINLAGGKEGKIAKDIFYLEYLAE